jgi:hypothetical protein
MSDADPSPRASRPDATGVQAVDDVVARIDGLDDRPLQDHAEEFEQAHQRLRRALDDIDPPAGPDASDASGR